MPRYTLFGLIVDAAMTLPDLPPSTATGCADVSIGLGTVPRAADDEPTGLSIRPDGAVLNIPEAGRYLIANGESIVVEPSSVASERNVRLYLLGSAFGAILHQRGLLPLHANIVDVDGAAVAFAGHSGAGKSTLANWFHEQGHRVLGDDVCVVRDAADGRAIVEAGMPRIRLWQDALDASGRGDHDYPASFDDMAKFDVPIVTAAAPSPLPLAAVYLLRAAAPGQAGSIERLGGVEAVQALAANTYRGAYIPLMDGVAQHLAQCVSLTRRVPVFALERRWGHDVFSAEAASILTHVHNVVAAQRQMPDAR